MKTKISLLLSLLLCCTMMLGIFTVTASAATADETPLPFSFTVDKTVVRGGDATPSEETFTFELEYGTIGENEHYSVVFTPDDSVTLADCGIAFTTNTITTNDAGKQTFTLGGTIDPTKVTAENHWQFSSGNDSVPKWIITLRLTEKNDGKAGWTYSDVERYLTITVIGNEISTDVHILGNDVSDNNFENTYTAYSFTVKKTDADGNPLAGATFSLTGTGNSIGKNFEAVSGSDGIATFDVPEGFYTLSEKTAPEGYIKSDKTYGIAIWGDVVHFYDEAAETDEDRYSDYQQVTFVNKPVETPTDPPKPADPQSPQTGDNSMMGLWIALLFVSGAGVVGTTVYGRKKKYSVK